MADADAAQDAGLQPTFPVPSTPVQSPVAPPPVPAAPAAEPEAMSLVEHLTELRSRLVKSIVAVLVFAAIGFWRAGPIIDVLRQPCEPQLRRSMRTYAEHRRREGRPHMNSDRATCIWSAAAATNSSNVVCPCAAAFKMHSAKYAFVDEVAYSEGTLVMTSSSALLMTSTS